MNVEKVMTRDVLSCHAEDPLSVPAGHMWERDIGAVPVIDAAGRAIAMITDRDIAMAAYLTGRNMDGIRVSEAMSATVFTVRPDQSVHYTEELMRDRQIRRVPVVAEDGKLIGVITLNDLARAARAGHRRHEPGVDPDEVLITLASIADPRPVKQVAF